MTKLAYISSCDFEFKSTGEKLGSLGGYDFIQADKNKERLDFKKLKDYDLLIISPDAVDYYDENFLISFQI